MKKKKNKEYTITIPFDSGHMPLESLVELIENDMIKEAFRQRGQCGHIIDRLGIIFGFLEL